MRNVSLSIVGVLIIVGGCESREQVTVGQSSLTASVEYSGPSAGDFVEQAKTSRAGSGAAILATLNSARTSDRFVTDLCDIVMRALPDDPQAALIPLSLLGEVKTPIAIDCLKSIMLMPWPTTGTCLGDDPKYPCARISEQEGLAVVQSKALDGLGFNRTADTDEVVLRVVSDHPDRGVRAHAVLVYMWNHQSDKIAKNTVLKFVRPGEETSADRVIKLRTDSADELNRKLQTAYNIVTVDRRSSL
jgi:hypothetical protein